MAAVSRKDRTTSLIKLNDFDFYQVTYQLITPVLQFYSGLELIQYLNFCFFFDMTK